MFRPAHGVRFTLQIPSVRHDFKVLAFEGTEAMSQLYCIRIELVSERPDFDLETLLSQPRFCSSAATTRAFTVASRT
jgi:uncharacterized protein involved in type VI secretion and phage assembly